MSLQNDRLRAIYPNQGQPQEGRERLGVDDEVLAPGDEELQDVPRYRFRV